MKALFVSYGGGHIGMVLPVMRELRRADPSAECLLMALTTGHRRAVQSGERPLGYRDFVHLFDQEAVDRWGRRLLGANSSPDVAEAESVTYLGINYLDLIAQYGEDGAAAHYSRDGRYGFLPIHFMRRVFDELRPDVVVATNSPRSEQAAVQVARERGIPCVGMVDLFGLDSDTFVLRQVRPTVTCVIAESVRERLLARGFEPHGVRVTGNPAFDGLLAVRNVEAAREFLARKGWDGLQVVLYAGIWEPVPHPATDVPAGRSFPIAVEGVLREYVRARPHTALVVRYHPGDWFHYPREPDAPRVHFSVPPAEPIHPLILAATVVVTTNSTVGLEAAVGGRAVVSIENSPSVHHWFSLATLGVSHPSPTHLDLPVTLDRVMDQPQPMRVFQSDGRAAERVAAVIAGIAPK